MAASPPGVCTVLPRIRWSYCSHTQRLDERSGEPTSFLSASMLGIGAATVSGAIASSNTFDRCGRS
jgi:hypothetical protein